MMQLGALGARCSKISIRAMLHQRCTLGPTHITSTLRSSLCRHLPLLYARSAAICSAVAEPSRLAGTRSSPASLQGPPSDFTRRHTANSLLSIISGMPLKDRGWVRHPSSTVACRLCMHAPPLARQGHVLRTGTLWAHAGA